MRQRSLFELNKNELLTLQEASLWASNYVKRKVSISNITYLIQYGKIKKYGKDGNILVKKTELKNYYDTVKRMEVEWKEKLGDDLNWHLSFMEFSEAERTKHVHRLHPYKGKFIPQLVEYFLDDHTDEFKKEVYFRKGDIVLDPFCGSGTTLVQANELGIHAIGVDISTFNVLISNVKVRKHNLNKLSIIIKKITEELNKFQMNRNNIPFENELLKELNKFNNKYFPSPDFKINVRKGIISENNYAEEKLKEFLPVFWSLVDKYKIKIVQDRQNTFLDRWFLQPVREEIDFLAQKINQIDDPDIRDILIIILSRTVRSSRATTHSDLATLKEPVTTPYYCKKHKKICKPLFSLKKWWSKYTEDTLFRLKMFDRVRTNTKQICLTGDSRNLDILKTLRTLDPTFAKLVEKQKISGIFTSPPYVGLINYHEQHAYAYEIFGFDRKDELEIGPLFKGQGSEARDSYVISIAQVLKNVKKLLKKDYNVFLVANDKYNLYPRIAELAGMKIIETFKRPVLNRVEKDRSAYAETIFRLKEGY